MNPDKASALIAKLLAKAASTTFPEERAACLAKVQQIKRKIQPTNTSPRPSFSEVREAYMKWKNQ